jgi:hypothetical protein
MPNPERLTPEDLVAGGQCLHLNRLFIRQIDAIEGDTVIYHDQYAKGRCGKRAFLKACRSRASAEDVDQSEEQLMRLSRTTTQDEFTLRDEANALTAFAFRNGFLEDLLAPPTRKRNHPCVSSGPYPLGHLDGFVVP